MKEAKNIKYRGEDIAYNFYGKGEYTICVEGDDLWFNSLPEAKHYVDRKLEKGSDL